jgi:hypothetical protein
MIDQLNHSFINDGITSEMNHIILVITLIKNLYTLRGEYDLRSRSPIAGERTKSDRW